MAKDARQDTMLIHILGYGTDCRGMAALCAESIRRLKHPPELIRVWTDQSSWFRDRGYSVRELGDQTIDDWKGPYGFALRLKILMMEEAITTDPDNLHLFSDADIYWRSLPNEQILASGTTALMHAHEPLFGADMLQRYNAAVGTLIPDAQFDMYNSGVLGFPRHFPRQHFAEILRLCDRICDEIPRKLGWAEQMAYTVAFARNYRIQTVDDDAYHYWGYNEEIARLMRGKSLDQWASLTFGELEAINRRAESMFNSPLYRWQNRWRKLRRSWRKSQHERIARRRRRERSSQS